MTFFLEYATMLVNPHRQRREEVIRSGFAESAWLVKRRKAARMKYIPEPLG